MQNQPLSNKNVIQQKKVAKKKIDPFVGGMLNMLAKTGGPNGSRAFTQKQVQAIKRKMK
jgi:hypothetical protein